MKKLSIIGAFIGCALLFPIKSYALVDAAFYGGYSIKNVVKSTDSVIRPYGWRYGIRAHYNHDIVKKILNVGAGAYYQHSLLTYEENKKNHDYIKHAVGLDAYLILEMEIVVHPFIRFSAAIWEDAGGENAYFQSFLTGGGLEFKIGWKMRVYGEYIYNFSARNSNLDQGHSVNFGLKFKM